MMLSLPINRSISIDRNIIGQLYFRSIFFFIIIKMVDNQIENSIDLKTNENPNESQDSNEKDNNDDYIRITAAHQMLVEGK